MAPGTETGVQVVDAEVQGFPALTVDNGVLALTVVPDLGGKISNIRDLRTGREWLWTSDRTPYRRVPYGASYVREADTGGWDECFPTVAPCAYPSAPWAGLALPDHGEVWPLACPLEVVRDSAARVALRAEVRGTALPYVFRRTITVDAGTPTLRVDYRVDNLGDAAMPFIWSAHPLFAVEAGMRVRLPEGTRMHAWLGVPDNLIPDEEGLTWPVRLAVGGTEVDLSRVPDAGAGLACKLWSDPLTAGSAALLASDGEFRFTFDPALVPQVGLWVNAGAWSGTGGPPYYNLALEPCIGAQDSLADAAERYGQYGVLPAGGAREWWLEVRLGADGGEG